MPLLGVIRDMTPELGDVSMKPPNSMHGRMSYDIYTVSQKNVPPLACYNFDTHEWILIFLAEMLLIK